MCSESKTTKPARLKFVNGEVDIQGLDGDVLDDGFVDLVWPDAPREKPVDEAGRDEEDNDDAEEGQAARPTRSPREPSKEEIDGHELTHAPHRSWCAA